MNFLQLLVACISVFFVAFIATNTLLPAKPTCANSISCLNDVSEKIENNAVGVFGGKEVLPPKIDLAADMSSQKVLGESDPENNSNSDKKKHIYVDLSTQKFYAYEGDQLYFETYTSTGRWGKTPTGNFNIWTKLRSTRMSGGSGADYYNLPNVPYTMYFYGDFGIHGAYWHNNFGHTMSHGCVNLRIVDAKKVFEWADGPSLGKKGTPVSVCDQFIAPDNCIQENPVK